MAAVAAFSQFDIKRFWLTVQFRNWATWYWPWELALIALAFFIW